MCHTWYFGDHPEDLTKVDSKREDMEDLNMVMENIVQNACCTFIKMPEHIEDKLTSIFYDVLHDHVEIHHVPPLAVLLGIVLIYVNLSSICSGIWIKV